MKSIVAQRKEVVVHSPYLPTSKWAEPRDLRLKMGLTPLDVCKFQLSQRDQSFKFVKISCKPQRMNAEVQYQGNSQFPTGEINVKSEPEPEQPPSAQQELPPSEWTTLRRQVEDNPYNEAAWNALIDKAEESGELEKVKETYEALLEKYPNTVRIRLSVHATQIYPENVNESSCFKSLLRRYRI